jgi:hypothetical protein
MGSSRLKWPALRFPPINLWVMSAWQEMARKQYQRRIRNPIESEKLRRTFLNLLAARGGGHGH